MGYDYKTSNTYVLSGDGSGSTVLWAVQWEFLTFSLMSLKIKTLINFNPTINIHG